MGYSIRQTAEETGVTAHTLRYYEKEGLIFDVKRDESGHREYSADNIELIKVIECLKSTGMTINEIKEYIHLFKGGPETYPDRIKLYQTRHNILKNKIVQLEEQRKVAEYKIWYYQNVNELGDLSDPLNCQKMREYYDSLQSKPKTDY